MASLTAIDNPIIVDPGPRASTLVEWDSGSAEMRVKIFERRNLSGPWTKRDLLDAAGKGEFSISLRAGDIYDYLMFHVDSVADPNEERIYIEEPLAKLRVVAILPKPSNLITDEGHDFGGTFYRRKVATGSSNTFATLQIGRTPPIAGAAGLVQIPNPVHVLGFADVTATIHSFIATPLDPGQLFFVVVFVHGLDGSWQQLQFAFSTKRRDVKLQWDKLNIIDDGIDIGSGSGFFRVTPFQGKTRIDGPLGDFWWLRTDFTTGQPFDMLPHNMFSQTGFQSVSGDDHQVRILLWGISYRSWWYSNDISHSSMNLPQSIKIPTGINEAVVNRTDTFYAMPSKGGGITAGFQFEASVIVNVTYAP